jgi:histidinol-phosphatase (PHP family)
MFDYHLHTPFCRHAEGRMEQYVGEALARGLQEICFTPHIPLPGFPRGPEGLRMEPQDAEPYFREIERLRAGYPQLSILCGVEADFYDGFEKHVEEFLGLYPLDLVLMSVHFVRDWPGENWVFGFDFPDRPLAAVYHDYFQALKRGIQSGLYDAVAHLDLIRQAGHPVLATNSGDVEEVLALAARAGMSLEINTSGMRRSWRLPYPLPEILPLAVAQGLPVITGSDAHQPHLVGHGFAEVDEWIAGVPGLQRVRYRARHPVVLRAKATDARPEDPCLAAAAQAKR